MLLMLTNSFAFTSRPAASHEPCLARSISSSSLLRSCSRSLSLCLSLSFSISWQLCADPERTNALLADWPTEPLLPTDSVDDMDEEEVDVWRRDRD